jgi:DNA-binding response OmpR family regulator
VQPDVLLIASEWRQRALIRAQLIEDGLDVMAIESSDEAELLLSRRAARPRAVILALEDEDQPEATLTALARLVSSDRLIVLTAAGALPADRARALGASRVISRPYDVGEVVRVARAVINSSRPAAPVRRIL